MFGRLILVTNRLQQVVIWRNGHFALLLVIMLLFNGLAVAQHASTNEFMTKAGFKEQDGCWEKSDAYQVYMNEDFVEKFRAVQTHDWQLVFGDGCKLGTTISLKKGDVITYEHGMLTLARDRKYQLNLMPGDKGLLRRGIIKSSIFNAERPLMSIMDINLKNPNGDTYYIGTLYEADGNGMEVNDNGNFTEKTDAHDKADKNLTAEIENAPIEVSANRTVKEYSSLCAKYGKSVIDGTLSGNIVIGAPIDLVKRVVKANANQWIQSAQNATMAQIIVEPTIYEKNTWHLHYHINYSTRTGRVTSYYSTRHFY